VKNGCGRGSGEPRKGKIQKEKEKSSGNVSFPNLTVEKLFAFEEIAEKAQAGMPMSHLANPPRRIRILECSNMFELFKERHVARRKAVTCHTHSKKGGRLDR